MGNVSNTSSPSELLRKFTLQHRMTQVEREHRAAGRRVERRDYYEFGNPSARGLCADAIAVIAGDLGVDAAAAREDYLQRGGRLRQRRAA